VSALIPQVQPAVSPVGIDSAACERVASLIGSLEVPADYEEVPPMNLAPAELGNFFLVLIAICHQTSPPDGLPLAGKLNGVFRRGWDYLVGRFADAVRADGALLSSARWSRISAQEVSRLFEDPELGNRLRGAEIRASLIRDLGAKMLAKGWTTANDLYSHCKGRVATGKPNLLEVLAGFRAYNDPVKKKSLYFLAVMGNTGLWKYEDRHSLGPPVDYHEVRGHLRLGTVQVHDPELLRRMKEGRRVTAEEDIALRRSVYDAIMIISDRSGYRNPSQLHYLFWNFFRAVCLRENPQCFRINRPAELPERYRHLATTDDGERCPFAGVCENAGAVDPLREHVFETDYY
jgi:hypothetical protein